MPVLSAEQIDGFVSDGFVHLQGAFDRATAAACVDELWVRCGADRHDRSTWTAPVIRVPGSDAAPIIAAINSDRLCGAMDDLVGEGRWQRRGAYGTFPIRFPSEVDPWDTGWHFDGSYRRDDKLCVNLWSRNRALLLLMLFSDIGPTDAPTRIRVGSHLDVPPVLVSDGVDGATTDEVMAHVRAAGAALSRPVADATGEAGDVYLCHPFLVHAAQWPHRGQAPRFMGQPSIHHTEPLDDIGFDYEVLRAELIAHRLAGLAGDGSAELSGNGVVPMRVGPSPCGAVPLQLDTDGGDHDPAGSKLADHDRQEAFGHRVGQRPGDHVAADGDPLRLVGHRVTAMIAGHVSPG